MRSFLDANILFSAAKSDGAVRGLCRWLLDAGHECVANDYVVTEARRNLVRVDAKAELALDALLGRLTVARTTPSPGLGALSADWLPEKDRPVLIAAMRSGCEVLLTGDRTHFGKAYGRTVGGVTIHSPRSLAETLMARPRLHRRGRQQ